MADTIAMADTIVEEAYKRVQRRFSDNLWLTLTPHAITDEIYREIRAIDAGRRNGKPAADADQDPVTSAAA